jgi:putative nucleotidyltransferase with HDIG domain
MAVSLGASMLSVLHPHDEGSSALPKPRFNRSSQRMALFRHLFSAVCTTTDGLTVSIGLLLTLGLTMALRFNDLDISRHINDRGYSTSDFYAENRMELVDAAATRRKIDRTQQSLPPIYQDETPHNHDILESLDKLLDQMKLLAVFPASGESSSPSSMQERRRRFLRLIEQPPNGGHVANADAIFVHHLRSSLKEADWDAVADDARSAMRKLLAQGFTEADEQLKRSDMLAASVGAVPHRDLVALLVDARLQPNRILDENAMRSKQEEVARRISHVPDTRVFEKGQKIVGHGEFVSPVQRAALEKMGQATNRHNFIPLLGSLMLSGLFVYGMWSSLRHVRQGEFFKPGYAALTAILVFLSFVCLQLHQQGAFWGNIPAFAFPLGAFALTLAVFTHPNISILCTALLVLLASLTLRTDFQSLAILLGGSCIGVYALGRRIHQGDRAQLMVAGFYVGAANALLLLALSLMKPNFGSEELVGVSQPTLINVGVSGLKMLGWSVFGGIFSGILTIGSLPLLELIFKLVTPYTLMELGNHDQPLLKRMQFEAPGTFHHSLTVATLAEAAAQAIGANALLTRVGCLYHDIGKMKRPLFFVENQAYFGVENPHDKLTPRLSKMVITAHPRDSLEMARQQKLPECLMSFMTEHHGTLTAGYFYTKACQEEGAENVNKSQFRYPGPKPGSRETAIVMLADACESAVRALKNPTVAEVEERIDKITRQRIDESQFDDCPITLQDLYTIKQTFVRILRGIQHNRIEYQQSMMLELGRKVPAVVLSPSSLEIGSLSAELNNETTNGNSSSASENNDSKVILTAEGSEILPTIPANQPEEWTSPNESVDSGCTEAGYK